MKIFSLICHNGLGHYKRSIAVLDALRSLHPGCEITVACEGWQIRQMGDWDRSVRFWKSGATHLDGLVAPGVRWDKNAAAFEDGSLLSWHSKLPGIKELMEADIVVSDNLPQVLHYRNDAVLLGSFLWADLLKAAYPDSTAVQAYAAEEQALLQRYRPPMLCVGDVAMPAVTTQTNAVPLPWFCQRERRISNPGERCRIGLLSGATEGITDDLRLLAQCLSATDRFDVFLPGYLLDKMTPHSRLHRFDFADESFASLDLLVCRPGIGTLTDSVRFSLPVIGIYEANNAEMEHNGSRIAELGIGLNLGHRYTADEAATRIGDFYGSPELIAAVAALEQRPVGGIEAAAAWLLEQKQ
jgi:hypothetical protein